MDGLEVGAGDQDQCHGTAADQEDGREEERAEAEEVVPEGFYYLSHGEGEGSKACQRILPSLGD